MAKISLQERDRQLIRAARDRLGVSRGALERRARLGQTYVKSVETGKKQSTEAATLARLLQVLQQQAERAEVPAKITAGLRRMLTGVAKQGEKPRKR
jgi:predicted transcriptional regulator